MSQGGQLTGENLIQAIIIHDLLIDADMDDQTKLESIVDEINEISGNPNPLPYSIDSDLILQEVEGFVMCM